jgi:hypothetical protein
MGVAFRVNLAVADPMSIAMAFMQDEIKSALMAKSEPRPLCETQSHRLK